MLQSSARADLFQRPLLRAMADALAETPDAARQDGLDFLAVVAGLKRVCLIGRGFADEKFSALLRRLAASAGLPEHIGAGWDPQGDLPAWYLAASTARRARQEYFYICADEATRREVAALAIKDRVTAAAEAALLSFPLCCVEEHHRRSLAIENLYAAWAGADIERAQRVIAAGLEPRPPHQAAWSRLAALAAIVPAAYTSVNMCSACAASEDGPAAQMSRRYRALALATGFRV
jgi:hypothetical protein